MSTTPRGTAVQGMLQELRNNRKTQAALAAFVVTLGLLLYTAFAPDAPKSRRAADGRTGTNLDSRQLQGLRKLPDLAALDLAGELPPKPKVLRDIFMFEAPPVPVKPLPPPPPPPPPSPEDVEQQRKAQAKAAEFATRPQDLRYLGFFKGTPSGLVGAFMKGEEPLTLTPGTVVRERWKLVSVLDTRAEFQNLTYPDLKLVLETREASGGAVSNQF